MVGNSAKTVGEYIKSFPKEVQPVANKLRELIKEVAPEAKEMISYQIPLYKINGKHYVAFAIYKKHYGFYPTKSSVLKKYKKELSKYKQSVGTVQFPIDEPFPFDLVKKMLKDRLEEAIRDTEGGYR